jgi:hypothetical protein
LLNALCALHSDFVIFIALVLLIEVTLWPI